jgi:chromosomal replication initiator protein
MTAEIYTGIEPALQKSYRFSIDPHKFDYVTKAVFEKLNVDLSEISSHCRSRHCVEARHISMYLLKIKTRASLKSIGIYFGGRDHSTVIYAIQTVNDLMETNKFFKRTVDELLEVLP